MKQERSSYYYKGQNCLYVFWLFYLAYNQAHSQLLGQDVEGYSTIVIPASNLNLDLTNDIATFSYYTYQKKNGEIPEFGNSRTILGGELMGGSKNGISPFFSEEKIVPEASMKFLVGRKFYSKKTISFEQSKERSKEWDRIRKNEEVLQTRFEKELKRLKEEWKIDKKVAQELERLTGGNSDKKIWDSVKVFLSKRLESLEVYPNKIRIYKFLSKTITSIQKYQVSSEPLKRAVENLSNYVKKKVISEEIKAVSSELSAAILSQDTLTLWKEAGNVIDDELKRLESINSEKKTTYIKLLEDYFDEGHLKQLDKYSELQKKIIDDPSEIEYTNGHLYYLRGGVNGSEFKYDMDNGLAVVEDRIINKKFNGWNLEAGYTAQLMDNNFVGFSFMADYTNNFSSLEETEYAFTQVDTTVTEGSFSTTEKIKAYSEGTSGAFDTFMRYSLNFDYVRVLNTMNKKNEISDLYLTLNPYLRHQVYHGAKELRNNTVLGVGLNAFNSEKQKIMGGLFIQTNDLFGVHSKRGVSLGERISIGLVAKFAFTGLDLKEESK